MSEEIHWRSGLLPVEGDVVQNFFGDKRIVISVGEVISLKATYGNKEVFSVGAKDFKRNYLVRTYS